ncbi:MAG: septal ring lytic transglycosylase RlpA family protein [Stellaceae bacterium]
MFKIGAPYEVKGVWYTPRADYAYDKTGTASWYGKQFQGRYTANGEVFDINRLSAAHTTLPLPSIVEVTNLRNGRSLQLRVNDRGPFADGRIIDVSRRAAQLLGFENAGVAPVHVRILPRRSIAAAEQVIRASGQDSAVLAAAIAASRQPVMQANNAPSESAPAAPQTQPMRLAGAAPSPPFYPRPSPEAASPPLPSSSRPAPRPAAAPAPAPYRSPFAKTPRLLFVQAGAFTREDAAQRLSSAIAPLGEVAIVTTSEHGYPIYRVCLGPAATGYEAEMLRARLVGNGYAAARIVEN